MKIKIDEDEWYPVFEFKKDSGIEVDVPKEIIDAVNSIASAFDEIQEYLWGLSDKAYKKKNRANEL